MPAIYSNFAKTVLANQALSNATTIYVSDLSKFPAFVNAGDFYKISLVRGLEFEIMYVTGVVGGNQITVQRGQEGTLPKTWPAAETEVVHGPMASDHTFFFGLDAKFDTKIGDLNAFNAEIKSADVVATVNKAYTTNKASIASTTETLDTLVNEYMPDMEAVIIQNINDISAINMQLPDMKAATTTAQNTANGAVTMNTIQEIPAKKGFGDGVNFRKGIDLCGPAGNSGAGALYDKRCIAMSTDTASWGGPYDDHACFVIVPYMPGGWGTGEMHVRISNGPGTAITPSALTIGHNAVVSNGDIGSLSDRRIKKEIKTLKGSLDKVLRLRGVSYKRKDSDSDGRVHIGLIAQEVDKEFPELVSETSTNIEKSTKILNVAYANMAGIFVESIKEFYKKFIKLETRTSKLEARIKELERLMK